MYMYYNREGLQCAAIAAILGAAAHDVGVWATAERAHGLRSGACSCRSRSRVNFLNTPRSLMCNGNNTKTGPERFKSRRREALGHHISVLLACRHVENSEITDLHVFTDEVNVELDVLRPFVVHRVR